MEENGISTSITYNDKELDQLIQEIKMQHPHDGEKLMAGHLAWFGIRVPRSHLRGSIHRVDPYNEEKC